MDTLALGLHNERIEKLKNLLETLEKHSLTSIGLLEKPSLIGTRSIFSGISSNYCVLLSQKKFSMFLGGRFWCH